MKTKSLFMFLTLMFIPQVFAVEVMWKLGSTFLSLSRNEEKDWLISTHCEERECDAKTALKIVTKKNVKPGASTGGKNPGAILCHTLKDANVVYLNDLEGNQNTFCQFKDSSLVSNSTLVIYADKNDKK